MSKPNWNNLILQKCPLCGDILGTETRNYECQSFGCDFQISEDKFFELTRKISNKKALDEFSHDNTEALNNL